MVRFHPLSDAIIARLALQKGIVADPEQAERLAVGSQGSLTRAGELADEALRDFRGRLYPLLASGIDDFAPGPPGACWVSSKRLARQTWPAASGCAKWSDWRSSFTAAAFWPAAASHCRAMPNWHAGCSRP